MTILQIKRSTSNVAPNALQDGEMAYSYLSNTLFIGDTANGVMNVGGVYYTRKLDNASFANGNSTLVVRASNGYVQLAKVDVLNDLNVTGNVTFSELNGGTF
jgi:hypothetical protein